MPKANTPKQAVERCLTPFNNAMRCVHQGTLIASKERSYEVGDEFSIVLNDADPVPLKTASLPVIYLSLGQKFEIVEDDTIEDGPFRVHTREYWYQFSLDNDGELLVFHWTPATQNPMQKRYPHLHIGRALLSSKTPILPGIMHKRHVPTGRLSVESIVRFAIEELEVQPLIQNWSDVLDQQRAQFDLHRRK